ncbi:MAG: hypothetical protein HQK62_04945 [Desulfamplus sp.]|nr:hypothetical protein [Desulfamplus sp.]
MLREIIIPKTDKYTINIPEEYINQRMEILVLPFSYDSKDHIDISETKAFSNHTASKLKDWLDDSEDDVS